jgi:hypothetical protein
MQAWIGRVLLGACVVSLACLALVEPAFANCFPACTLTPPQPAPGPLIGFGLPLAGAAVAALLIVRRLRPKE